MRGEKRQELGEALVVPGALEGAREAGARDTDIEPHTGKP